MLLYGIPKRLNDNISYFGYFDLYPDIFLNAFITAVLSFALNFGIAFLFRYKEKNTTNSHLFFFITF